MASNAPAVTDNYFWRVLDGLPDNDAQVDVGLGVILTVFTVILAGASLKMLRLVLLYKACEANPSFSASFPSLNRRSRGPGLYTSASLVMFFLFLAATIVYWNKVFLSLNETLCLLQRLPQAQEALASRLNNPEETRVVVAGCRTMLWRGRIVNELDNGLCLAFAVLAQLFLFIADGLLVYRCYHIFTGIPLVYAPVMVIYVVYIGVSIFQLYPPLKAPDQIVNLKSGPFYALWLATSIAINIVVTAAIATRILLVRQKSAQAGLHTLEGRNLSTTWNSVYKKIAVVLVESALCPAVFGVAMTIAYYAPPITPRSNVVAFRIFDFLWLGTSVLAPQLIAIQTLQRRGASRGCAGFSDSAAQGTSGIDDSRLNTLVFKHSTQTGTFSSLASNTTIDSRIMDMDTVSYRAPL